MNNMMLDVSNEVFLRILDFLPYPFILAKENNGIHYNTYINDEFIEEFGFTLEDIPTREDCFVKIYPDSNYRHELYLEWIQNSEIAKEKNENFVKVNARITNKYNIEKWYEVKQSQMNDIHFIAFVDIDKEVRLQEDLKKINENNKKVLAILGHDLRGPIRNLASLLSMFHKNKISKDQFISYTTVMEDESHKVLDLLDTTLNWAKLNFNFIKPNYSQVDTLALVNEIIDIYRFVFEKKGIEVTVSNEGNQYTETDKEVLNIIIRNLFSNAIKFSKPNGTIEIKITPNEIIIQDSGTGMSEKDIEKILKGKSTSKKGTKNEVGIGIGLKFVNYLVEKIDCSLSIKSELNKGTKMILTFKNLN